MSLLDGTMLWFLNTILMERLQSNMPTSHRTSKSECSRMEAHQERTKAISPSLQNLSSFSTQEDSSRHQSLLSNLSTYSKDLDLTFRLDKCISVIFNGNKMDHKITFSLGNGLTRNIAEAPTKILGKLIAGSSSLTKQTVATSY